MFLGGERERIALEDLSGRAISYGSLARSEDRCGELLSSQLAQRSAVVVDAAEPLLLACLLVSLSSHRPVHPVPPTTTAYEAQGLVADIAPALLVTDDVDRPLAREMRKLGLAVFEAHWTRGWAPRSASRARRSVGGKKFLCLKRQKA